MVYFNPSSLYRIIQDVLPYIRQNYSATTGSSISQRVPGFVSKPRQTIDLSTRPKWLFADS